MRISDGGEDAFLLAESPPIAVTAPMCVQATYWTQSDKAGRRVIVHLFNNVSTTAGNGLPAAEVPLREETLPISGIRIRFERNEPKRVRVEPGARDLPLRKDGTAWYVEVPPLELQATVVGEY